MSFGGRAKLWLHCAFIVPLVHWHTFALLVCCCCACLVVPLLCMPCPYSGVILLSTWGSMVGPCNWTVGFWLAWFLA
ncbi:hypothetical protein COO60DRAFT_1502874 [Scenedesmus sp. NREL 46B-D3]|nr:hypothetical protein COO60DRAFT_1502874 [Scenedesmus sp. NREL 46B-D3]